MLENTGCIDLVTQNDRDRCCELVLVVEKGEWAAAEPQRLLQEKINSYLVYALEGQLLSEYPDLAPIPKKIVLQSVDPIPPAVLRFIDRLTQAVAGEGMRLEVLPL